MRKRILTTFVLLCMVLSLLPAAAAASFTDVEPSAYYYAPVQWAMEKGLTAGTGSGTFSPNAPCTRGQVVTFLWNAAGQPEPRQTSSSFVDVSSNDYFCKAVLWAAEEGIASGTDAAHFTPDRACSRGEAVTFLWRSEGCPGGTASYFNDVSRLSYYKSAVDWAVGEGITSGTGNDGFSPNGPCTRGQIVTFLYRVEHPVKVNSGTPAWCQAYMTFLQGSSYVPSYLKKTEMRFQLAYIDSNSIPELVVGSTDESHGAAPIVYTYYGGRVVEVGSYGSWGGFSYAPDHNLIISAGMWQGYTAATFYRIENGKNLEIISFEDSEATGMTPVSYKINNRSVSKATYENEYNKTRAGKQFISLDGGKGVAINSTNIAKISTNPNGLVK